MWPDNLRKSPFKAY